MIKHYKPDSVAPPFSRYSHAVEAPAAARCLHVSGQIGVMRDGTIAEGAEAQLEQAWRNIFAILEAAGMTKRDLVKTTTFLTPHAADVGLSRRVRERIVSIHTVRQIRKIQLSNRVPAWN